MGGIHTTREVANLLGVAEWQVRRLYESHSLPEPPRFGGKRAVPGESIPNVVDALRDRGWLPSPVQGRSPVDHPGQKTDGRCLR